MARSNDLLSGFQAGMELGGMFQRAMIQRDLMERQKRQEERADAILQLQNPGLQVGRETMVEGQQAVRALPVAPGTEGDQVQALGGGYLYNPAVKERLMAANDAREMQNRLTLEGKLEDIRMGRAEKTEAMKHGYMTSAEQQRTQNRRDELQMQHGFALDRGDREAAAKAELEMGLLDKRLKDNEIKRSLATKEPMVTITEEDADGTKYNSKVPYSMAQQYRAQKAAHADTTLAAEQKDLEAKGAPGWFSGRSKKQEQDLLDIKTRREKLKAALQGGASLQGTVSSSGMAGVGGVRKLTPEIAADFLRQAGNDREKAMKLAAAAGFSE